MVVPDKRVHPGDSHFVKTVVDSKQGVQERHQTVETVEEVTNLLFVDGVNEILVDKVVLR